MKNFKNINSLRNDDQTFEEICSKLEENHGSRIKRIVRTAEQDGLFYFTVILESYEMLEVKLTPARFAGMPALEIEVEVF
jgi:hypothetical protein